MKFILKRLGSSSLTQVKPYLPKGLRIYCIGDIHGRVDLLHQINKKILQDVAGYTGKRQLVCLGDYIDRGEHSKEVIDFLLECPFPEFNTIFLRGNHEQALLDFLEQSDNGPSWLKYGGLETLLSYKVRLNKFPAKNKDYVKIQNSLRKLVPIGHMEFFKMTRMSYSIGSYYFVHAGIKPDCPLNDQVPENQLWIREKFVTNKNPHEKIIIHGHTISEEADIYKNRIGLDTGAYLSGKLTCLVLETNTQRIIQTNA